MKIWAKTQEYSEGKYLVVRRDGTIPTWPHFVIGGDDPNAPAALRGYANQAESNGLDNEYVQSVRDLASDFEKRTGGKADPDAGPHRNDNLAIIALMRGEGDLSSLMRLDQNHFCTGVSEQKPPQEAKCQEKLMGRILTTLKIVRQFAVNSENECVMCGSDDGHEHDCEICVLIDELSK